MSKPSQIEFKLPGKLSSVVSKDSSEAIYHAWIEEEDFVLYLCASDKYKIVALPVAKVAEGDDMTAMLGQVPHDALLQAERTDEKITIKEKYVMVGANASFRRFEMQFPELRKATLTKETKEPNDAMRVAIDTRLLHELAQGLGSDKIEMVFNVEEGRNGLYNTRIYGRVYEKHGTGAQRGEAVIMPCQVADAK